MAAECAQPPSGTRRRKSSCIRAGSIHPPAVCHPVEAAQAAGSRQAAPAIPARYASGSGSNQTNITPAGARGAGAPPASSAGVGGTGSYTALRVLHVRGLRPRMLQGKSRPASRHTRRPLRPGLSEEPAGHHQPGTMQGHACSWPRRIGHPRLPGASCGTLDCFISAASRTPPRKIGHDPADGL
jgi:hypothetical protein